MSSLPAFGRRWRLPLVTIAIVAVAATSTPAAASAQGQILGADRPTAIHNSYIVVLKDTAADSGVAASARDLARRYGGAVGHTYEHALRGFEIRLPEAAAKRLAAHPAVHYVEQNQTLTRSTPDPNALAATSPWGLDRIDQRYLPLDDSYRPPNTGSLVRAYVLDTGIRASHSELSGRVLAGYSAIGGTTDDCNGHGTAVASIVGGTKYGVAKAVRFVPVRVLSCAGSGTYAAIIAGIDWVTGNAVKPAVAVIGFGGSGIVTALDDAVSRSIGSGVSYAVAGVGGDACSSSPGRVGTAITVSGTDQTDTRPNAFPYGSCLDLFAPGIQIPAAGMSLNSTAGAAAHVAGAVALLLTTYPTMSPTFVKYALTGEATVGPVLNAGPGSPNRLLFVGNFG